VIVKSSGFWSFSFRITACSFLSRVEVPAMRHGSSQAVETLISEAALLLAKYLRNEKSMASPVRACSNIVLKALR
jgi:hypothetical protein